jgi:hypothetical protein
MSAVIGVAKPDCIELLTDAAHICADSGRLVRISGKQLMGTGCVLSVIGWDDFSSAFAARMQPYSGSFDLLVRKARRHWIEALRACPFPSGLTAFGEDVGLHAVVAGYSDERQALGLYAIGNDDNALSEVSAVSCGGPPASRPVHSDVVARFGHHPEAFDAHRDGIAAMGALRRCTFGAHACVGGYVQHSRIEASGVTTAIIHRWVNDRVGHAIELEAT